MKETWKYTMSRDKRVRIAVESSSVVGGAGTMAGSVGGGGEKS